MTSAMTASPALHLATVAQTVTRLARHCDSLEALTQAVLADLTMHPTRMRAALEELVPQFCVKQLGADLRHVFRASETEPKGNPSPKVAGIRQWHAAFLDSYLSTPRGFIRMREATVADLFAAAERRATAAVENAEAAERFRRLAAALESSHGTTVADLPEAVVREALRDRDGGK